MIAPRSRAASVTWWPMRVGRARSRRARCPTISPRWRTSPTPAAARRAPRAVGRAARSSAARSRACRSSLEDLERRERRGAGQRVARVGVAVEEGLALVVTAEEALVDALGRERRGERQVAAGEALGHAHEVGRRRPPARRRTSCPVRPKPVATSSQISSTPCSSQSSPHRRAGSRAGARASRPRPGRAARRSPRRCARRARRGSRARSAASPGSAWWRVEQQRAVDRVEQLDAADRHRADRVAVVAVAQADELAAPPSPRCADATGRPSSARSRWPSSRCRRRRRGSARSGAISISRARQLDRRRVGEAEHRRVRDPVELRAHRRVDRAGGGGRGRCTTATRRRRCRRCRRCRTASCPRARSMIGAAPPGPALLLGERVPEVARSIGGAVPCRL